MNTLIVNIKVASDKTDAFIEVTRRNIAHSRAEPGIARFEFLQDQADAGRFVLIETYRDAEAQAAHKETAHYLEWKALAEPMMSEPRTRALYSEIEP